MSFSHKLRSAAKPGAYIETIMLEQAADHIDKLEKIVFDKLDALTITPSPSQKRASPSKSRTPTTRKTST